MPHDGYLKLFALSKPNLQDVLLFDEAQDTNPVTTGLLVAQAHPIVIVGDPQHAFGPHAAWFHAEDQPLRTRFARRLVQGRAECSQCGPVFHQRANNNARKPVRLMCEGDGWSPHGVVQMSSTSCGVLAREQHGVNWSLSACSSGVMNRSL